MQISHAESYIYTCNNYIIPVLGKHRVQKLTPAHINDYLKTVKAWGLAPSSVTRLREIIHYPVEVSKNEK